MDGFGLHVVILSTHFSTTSCSRQNEPKEVPSTSEPSTSDSDSQPSDSNPSDSDGSRPSTSNSEPPSEPPPGSSSSGCTSTWIWSCGWELLDSDCENPEPPEGAGSYDGAVMEVAA